MLPPQIPQRKTSDSDTQLKPTDLITQIKKPNRLHSTVRSLLGLNGCWNSVFKCLVKSRKLDAYSPHQDDSLPPLLFPQPAHLKGRKTLVLDLDETLIHGTFRDTKRADLNVPVTLQGVTYYVQVFKRPGLKEFLEKVSSIYEVVLFTASLPQYAKKMVEKIDPQNHISTSLYRNACTIYNKKYVKDLSRLGRKMKDIIILDNSESCFMFQPENAFQITDFFDDRQDVELLKLVPFLEYLSKLDDVRNIGVHWKNFDKSYFKDIKPIPWKNPQVVKKHSRRAKACLQNSSSSSSKAIREFEEFSKIHINLNGNAKLADLMKTDSEIDLTPKSDREIESTPKSDEEFASFTTQEKRDAPLTKYLANFSREVDNDLDLGSDENATDRVLIPNKNKINQDVTFNGDCQKGNFDEETEPSSSDDTK